MTQEDINKLSDAIENLIDIKINRDRNRGFNSSTSLRRLHQTRQFLKSQLSNLLKGK